MCARLKYFRSKEKKTQPIPDDESETDMLPNALPQIDPELSEATSAIQTLNIGDNHMESVVDSESLQRNDVRSLRTMVVNDGNMNFIREMLFKTREYRAKMTRDKKIDFRVEFPFFFTNPELV